MPKVTFKFIRKDGRRAGTPWSNGRKPLIYDPDNAIIYYGQAGTHHCPLYAAIKSRGAAYIQGFMVKPGRDERWSGACWWGYDEIPDYVHRAVEKKFKLENGSSREV